MNFGRILFDNCFQYKISNSYGLFKIASISQSL